MPDAPALRDIHLPEPVSWWPPAPGWWLLVALLLGLLALASWLGLRAWRAGRTRRAALRELRQLAARAPSAEAWQELNSLLKRTALQSETEDFVAGLHAEAWTEYLARDWPESSRELLPLLASQPYRKHHDATGQQQLVELLDGARTWIRRRA